jgi:sugar/nucleoside kinase (ribokinase family)
VQADLNIISHLVLDDKEFLDLGPPREEIAVLGGPPAYATMVIPLLALKTRIITAIGKDFPEAYLQYLYSLKYLELEILRCEKSTRFLHKIYSDKRNMFLLSQADNLDSFAMKQKGAEACLISPVFGEISNLSMQWITKNHKFVGLDVQGFVRNTSEDNKITLEFDYGAVKEIIEQANIVKFSLNEAQSFTKQKSYTEIFKHLPESITNLITLGAQGLVFNIDDSIYKLNAPIKREADPTGAGDVLMTGILASVIEGHEIDYSICFGMALAAEKVKHNRIQTLPSDDYDLIAGRILKTKEKVE